MVVNFSGPYVIEIKYTFDGITHSQQLNVDVDAPPIVGADPTTVLLKRRDLTTVTLPDFVVLEWTPLIVPFWDATGTIDGYDFWSVAPLSEDRTFITAGTIGAVGTGAVTPLPAMQITHTYRTQEGGIYKTVFLDCSTPLNTKVPLSSLGGATLALSDYVVSTQSPILAKDTSFPIAKLNAAFGQNEHLFRRRFRN